MLEQLLYYATTPTWPGVIYDLIMLGVFLSVLNALEDGAGKWSTGVTAVLFSVFWPVLVVVFGARNLFTLLMRGPK